MIVLGVVLAIAALGAVGAYKIGPRNIVGMLRYDQRREGDLKVGDRAPDIGLVALDGVSQVSLHQLLGKRPLVLIFGSYT